MPKFFVSNLRSPPINYGRTRNSSKPVLDFVTNDEHDQEITTKLVLLLLEKDCSDFDINYEILAVNLSAFIYPERKEKLVSSLQMPDQLPWLLTSLILGVYDHARMGRQKLTMLPEFAVNTVEVNV
uniref:Uncharacterized protein n=1 Tax=Salix viminalis TaxID=40686 RepID=A0A6N2MJF2_SALVM